MLICDINFSISCLLHCVTGSRFIHISRHDPISFLFRDEWYSIAYMHHFFFINSSASGYLGFSHVLTILNSTSMNTGVPVSFWIMVFSGYTSSSGIAGSYDNSIFYFEDLVYFKLKNNINPGKTSTIIFFFSFSTCFTFK